MEELIMLFNQYVCLTNEIPAALLELPPVVHTKVRTVDVDESEEEAQEKEFRIVDIEVEDLDMFNVNVPRENISLDMTYDSIINVWMLSYYPTDDKGFEVMGTSFEGVIEASTLIIKNKVAFLLGEQSACFEELDKDFEYFISNRWEEDHA